MPLVAGSEPLEGGPAHTAAAELAAAFPHDSEKVLQTWAVAGLGKMKRNGLAIAFAGDMTGMYTPAETAAQWARNTGLTKGEPDLRVYAHPGRTLFIEMKTAIGRLTPAQAQRHAELVDLGFTVLVIRAHNGAEAQRSVCRAVLDWMGLKDAQVEDWTKPPPAHIGSGKR